MTQIVSNCSMNRPLQSGFQPVLRRICTSRLRFVRVCFQKSERDSQSQFIDSIVLSVLSMCDVHEPIRHFYTLTDETETACCKNKTQVHAYIFRTLVLTTCIHVRRSVYINTNRINGYRDYCCFLVGSCF